MQVARTDGGVVWTAVDEWRPWGLGLSYPEPLRWSAGGRYLFFTNVPVLDGCVVYVNSSDLWLLDLSSGQVTEIVPTIGYVTAVSPDGQQLAVAANNHRGLLIRNLVTGDDEQSVLYPKPGDVWQMGGLQWSPNGQTLLLTQVLKPCSSEETTAVVRVDIDTLTATTIIAADDRR